MLGVIPVHHYNSLTVLGCTLYNLIITAPFVAAFWVLTEWYDYDNDGACGGIPWDVANFARWAFLGFAAYQLCSLPFHLYQAIRRDKLNRDVRIHPWLKMFDALHWLANWALWFYLITALVNRGACAYSPLINLLWCVVFISGGFGLVGLIVLLFNLFTNLVGLIKSIKNEAVVADKLEKQAAQQRAQAQLNQGGGAVEILEIRKAHINPNTERAAVNLGVYERDGLDIEGRGERILDKVQREEVYERESRIIREKKPEDSQTRERHEAINLRDEPRVERRDYEERRAADNRGIRDYSSSDKQRAEKY